MKGIGDEMRERLFAVAIFALKPGPALNVTLKEEYSIGLQSPRFPGEDSHDELRVEVVPGVEMAQSEEQAIEFALAQAHRLWPESEGYIHHRAHVVPVEYDLILEAAAKVEAEMRPEDDSQEHLM
jgi:hypothetical protein